MSAIKVNLDGLDSSAVRIRTVASTLNDLKSSMNGVFSSIDPKIKRRRNIDGSIADIQKEMEMLYTEMNELSRFISSSKSRYANTEARLVQMSNDYTNRLCDMMAESTNAEEILLGLMGNTVIGKAKSGLESFLKQAGDLMVNVGSKMISGVEGVAVSSVLNYVEGFANIGFGIAEFFHLVPGTTARYEFKHDLDALQATIADQYVLDKKWYYGGRTVGDIGSSIVGTKIAANGLITVAAGLAGEGVGVGFTVTGAGAVAGVPAMAVSGAAVTAGALEVAVGLSVSAVSFKNFNDDFSKFQQEGEAKGESNSGIPVKEKTTASNGLDYQSNPKHTSGQPGNRPNAGIEPKNSLDLFGESIPSTQKPNQRFTFDKETNTLHRFYDDGNGTWHWSGSTNQGANSIKGSQVPNDIKNIFDLPKKGW